jgi:hypothetical protein
MAIRRGGGAGVLSLIILMTAVHCYGQTSSVQITSPASGTLVTPGQTVTVNVSAVGTFQAVLLFAQDPFPDGGGLTAPPFQFSIAVPSNIAPGPYSLTATGVIAPGQVIDSPPITIDVENTAQVLAVQSNLGTLLFQFVGQQIPLTVSATFTGGGPAQTVSRSSLIQYFSNNTTVVSVSSGGIATAIGPGNTTITITYGGKSANVSVSVPASTRGDLNGDGKVDIDDLNILDSFLNTPANGANDARDLNHDGLINALDARILVTLCTYPRCATHQ